MHWFRVKGVLLVSAFCCTVVVRKASGERPCTLNSKTLNSKPVFFGSLESCRELELSVHGTEALCKPYCSCRVVTYRLESVWG